MPGEPTLSRGDVQRFHVLEGMALVAGLGIALWLFTDQLRDKWEGEIESAGTSGSLFLACGDLTASVLSVLMGGLSLASVPLLLGERVFRPTKKMGIGKLLWLINGIAPWLLWPAFAYRKVARGFNSDVDWVMGNYRFEASWFALIVLIAFWVSGRLGRRGRRILRVS